MCWGKGGGSRPTRPPKKKLKKKFLNFEIFWILEFFFDFEIFLEFEILLDFENFVTINYPHVTINYSCQSLKKIPKNFKIQNN